MAAFEIIPALAPELVVACRELFLEYERGLGVSLCFQGFERELATLPGDYASPAGRLFLARAGAESAGCIALRSIEPRTAEMKRLYVRPQFRALGLGRALAERVIAEARAIGYRTMRLDTLPSMRAAQQLYAELGFRDAARYNDNPVEGVRFMALEL
jgi:ribosomal protein S18 acetylase RimI-like enzyme